MTLFIYKIKIDLLSILFIRSVIFSFSALGLYQDVHQRFPDSVECLKLLVRLCTEMGMREEIAEYSTELKRLERTKEVRDRVSSSRPNTGKNLKLAYKSCINSFTIFFIASRRSASSVSSRSGVSPVPEASRMTSPIIAPRKVSGNLRNGVLKLTTLRDSVDSMEESGYSQSIIGMSSNIAKRFI